jgi:uncharacterized membrane protein YccC
VNRLAELVATVLAGAAGSAVAALTLGASLFLVVPISVGVGMIILAAGHESPPRGAEHDGEHEQQIA